MAVTSTNRIAGPFIGNSATAVFPFTFKVFTAADLFLVVVDSLGNASVLVLGTDYAAVLNGDQDTSPGGTVTLTAALATGERMTITSGVESLQEVVLTNLGGFFPTVLNAVFDRLTILNQQVQQGVNQSIKLGLTDDLSSTQLPSAAGRAGTFLTFDGDGDVALAPLLGGPIDYVTAEFTATATSLPSGDAATAVLSGGNGVYALALGVPAGPVGAAATVAVGAVTTGASGSAAAVTNTGTSGAAVLNFELPAGPATVAIGAVTTLAAGASATVVDVGTPGAAVLNIALPAGAPGGLTAVQVNALAGGLLSNTRNLCDPSLIVGGSLINWQTGAIVSTPNDPEFFITGPALYIAGQALICSVSTQFGNQAYGWAFYSDLAGTVYLGGITGQPAETAIPASAIPVGTVTFRTCSGGTGSPVPTQAQMALFYGNVVPNPIPSFSYVDTASLASQLGASNNALLTYLLLSAPLGANLLNPATVTPQSLIAWATGDVVAEAGSPFFATALIPVIPGKTIYCNRPTNFGNAAFGFAFRGMNQAYVSGVPGVPANTGIVVPPNCYFVAFGGAADNGPAAGTSLSYAINAVFQSFAYTDLTTTLSKVGVLERSTRSRYANLVDPLGITPRFRVGVQSGVPVADNSGAITDYFNIAGLTSITANQPLYGTPFQEVAGTNSLVVGSLFDIYENWLADLTVAYNGTDNTFPAGTPINIPQVFGAVLCRLSFTSTSTAPYPQIGLFKVNAGTVSYPFSDLPGAAPRIYSRWAGALYVCVGDSITEHGASGGINYGYQTALCAALGMTKVIDAGISSQQMVDIMTMSEYTSILNQASIAALGPNSLISIYAGTNDFGNTAVPIGAMTDTTSATFMGAIDQIINTYPSWNPYVKLVFFTPTQRMTGTTPNSLGFVLLDYVNAIIAKCAQYSVSVIDLYRTSGLTPINTGTFTLDGLHPNQAGYEYCLNPRIIAGVAAI